MTVALIWAADRVGALGSANTIPWRVPEDQRRFRELTSGHPVVMGRRTWDSLPPRFRPLPGRLNIVISRDERWRADGATRAGGIDEALDVAAAHDDTAFVTGGGQIYALAIARADRMHITDVDLMIDAPDAYVPDVNTADWVTESDSGWMTSTSGTRYRYRDLVRADGV